MQELSFDYFPWGARAKEKCLPRGGHRGGVKGAAAPFFILTKIVEKIFCVVYVGRRKLNQFSPLSIETWRKCSERFCFFFYLCNISED